MADEKILYKGYVESNNKVPVKGTKIKDNNSFYSLDEITNMNIMTYSGVLNDGIVLLDFDTENEANLALNIIKMEHLNCKVIQTSRGIHCLFKSDDKYFKVASIHKDLAVGLKADIKLGSKNGLEFLKVDGLLREVIYETDEIDVVPYYFRPVKFPNGKYNFLNMSDSDGRNNSLFTYIPYLLKIMSKDECKDTIKKINSFIFAEPLEDREIYTILRDDAIDNAVKETFFDDKGRFKHDIFAESLVKTKKIIKIDNQLYIYRENDGIYINGDEWIEREMIKSIPNLTQAKRKEVFSYLKLIVEDNSNPSEFNNYIAFRNGIYDIIDKKLLPFSSDYIITNKIDWNYNPTAYSENIESMFDKISCGDDAIKNILFEMVGYTFFRQNEMGKSFILVGPKSNGKSTLQSVLQKLIGARNFSSIDLKDLGERFKTAELYGKLANIGDDIGDGYIDDSNIFKTIVTGGRLMVEEKGQKPFEFDPYVKCIFSANNLPRTRDTTGAIKRRLVIIPFDREFKPTDADFDPYLKYKLINGTAECSVDDNMSYLINKGLEGLDRVLRFNGFTESYKVNNAIDEYDKDNNPIKYFFDDLGDVRDAVNMKSTVMIYQMYCDFCDENSIKKMSKISFGKLLKAEYGITSKPVTVNGQNYRAYVIE